MQTPTVIGQDLDDTARLILMDQPDLTITDLRRSLRAEGCITTFDQVLALGRKYLGHAGAFATHSVNTGQPYRW
jgi:hypothetical protein